MKIRHRSVFCPNPLVHPKNVRIVCLFFSRAVLGYLLLTFQLWCSVFLGVFLRRGRSVFLVFWCLSPLLRILDEGDKWEKHLRVKCGCENSSHLHPHASVVNHSKQTWTNQLEYNTHMIDYNIHFTFIHKECTISWRNSICFRNQNKHSNYLQFNQYQLWFLSSWEPQTAGKVKNQWFNCQQVLLI